MTRLFLIICCALLVTGCSSFRDRENYDPEDNYSTAAGNPKDVTPEDSGKLRRTGLGDKAKGQLYQIKPAKSLEVPPDLVSSTRQTVLDNATVNPETTFRVLPEISGARIVNEDGDYRLVVDTSVENAWKVMTEYWALSNISLVKFNPEAGIMETEWVEEPRIRQDGSAVVAIAKEIFTSLTRANTALDKFQLRFERLAENQSAIHVSQRWITRKERHYARRASEFAWVELEQDDERVAAFMNNIILLFDPNASAGL